MTDEELKRLVQEGMEAELEEVERILAIVNSDPVLKDIQAPPEIRQKLFAQIEEYEEQQRLANLTDEEREWIKCGKIYHKRRRWNRYVVLAAALVAVLALGTISMGEDKNILTMLKQMITGGEQTVSDSGSTEPTQYVEEQEVFEKINDTYNFAPVKLEYLPEKTVFLEAIFCTDMQGINMYYGKNGTANIIYTIRPNYRESSFATIIEDEKIQEYTKNFDDTEIILKEYRIKETGNSRWLVTWTYQEVEYQINITDAEQEDVEKIVNTLSFYE